MLTFFNLKTTTALIISCKRQVGQGGTKIFKIITHERINNAGEIKTISIEQIAFFAKEYLDSLIAQQFLSSERQKINQMLEELALQVKQLKAKLYKLQFELSQKADEAIEISSFKEQLIAFRKDYDTLSQSQIKASLLKMIKEIIYYPNKLTIQFSILSWPVDFEC